MDLRRLERVTQIRIVSCYELRRGSAEEIQAILNEVPTQRVTDFVPLPEIFEILLVRYSRQVGRVHQETFGRTGTNRGALEVVVNVSVEIISAGFRDCADHTAESTTILSL